MFKNYFKTAWRNMRRNKVNSVINITGLGIGMACVILIILFVQDETSYDKFLRGADHIFQVNMTFTDKDVTNTTGGNTAPAVGPTLARMYPEVESYVRIYRPTDVLVRNDENGKSVAFYSEKRLWAVDSNFLRMFSYDVLNGDAASSLEKPNSVVITEATAKKYFGSASAVGKTLLFDTDKKQFTVTAVLKNMPPNSTFQFDLLVPISTYGEVKKRSWNWFWLQTNTYVKLKNTISVDSASVAKLEAKFPEMVKLHAFNSDYGQSYDAFVKEGKKLEYSLLPFTSIHLRATPMQVQARLTTLSDIKYIYIFLTIALFAIVLACVNFMNLSTAQSATRAKEIGVRKVMGSAKQQLIKQFLTEALLYSLISIVLAFIIVTLLLQPFNELAGKSLQVNSIFSGNMLAICSALWLFSGMLAGLYPAFYMTSFNPVEVLKGTRLLKKSGGNLLVRNGLVVFQFAVSIGLIVCTIVVFKQLKYAQEKDLGLTKENVIVIANTKRLGTKEEAFRQELSLQPGILDASISSGIPTITNFGDGYTPEGTEIDKPLLNEIGLSSFMVDNDFVPTLDLKVIQGRNFSKEFNDSASVILNESAAKQIGWKNPVGKYLGYPGNDQRFQVVGVVKDFNVASLREVVEPFALFNDKSKTYGLSSSYISVRLKAGNIGDRLHTIESLWKSFVPATPFDFTFLDEDFDAMYRSEQRMGAAFGVFTALSILIACLGLFGLSIFTAERRKKEIGVRKVLGASIQSLITLLSVDFLKLVFIAAIIAFPIAWLSMNKWLQDFAYRITIDWSIFFIAGITALIIAMLTVSIQAIKAALANPVKSLRTE